MKITGLVACISVVLIMRFLESDYYYYKHIICEEDTPTDFQVQQITSSKDFNHFHLQAYFSVNTDKFDNLVSSSI